MLYHSTAHTKPVNRCYFTLNQPTCHRCCTSQLHIPWYSTDQSMVRRTRSGRGSGRKWERVPRASQRRGSGEMLGLLWRFLSFGAFIRFVCVSNSSSEIESHCDLRVPTICTHSFSPPVTYPQSVLIRALLHAARTALVCTGFMSICHSDLRGTCDTPRTKHSGREE